MTHTDILEGQAIEVTAPSDAAPIVVALKPFDGGEGTIPMAHWLAGRHGSRLHAVSVLEMGDVGAVIAGLPPLPDEYFQRERDEVAADAQARLARCDDTSPTAVEIVQGAPSSSVCDVALARHASMIVTGTGRHGTLGRFLYGERALEIVRNARNNVFIVPPNARPPIRRAMVAVDFSRASLNAALAALEILGPGGQLSLVHVEDVVPHPSGRSLAIAETRERDTRAKLTRFVEALPLPVTRPIRLDTAIVRGDVVAALLTYAETHDVQLIACGRSRHSLLQRLFVGSVSAALIRVAPCCVLVAPDAAVEDEVGPNAEETESSTNAAEWRTLLQRLSERNAGRATRVSLAAPARDGVESMERGFLLLSLDYDRRGGRADIILGDPHAMGSHLTHRITGLRRVETVREPGGRESRIRFDASSGQCTINFMPSAGERTMADQP